MQLMIEISEYDYDLIKHRSKGVTSYPCTLRMYDAIANGILLPKGYEKLIAEPTEEEIKKTIGGQNDFADCIRDAVKAVFDNAQTVIEADGKEGNTG